MTKIKHGFTGQRLIVLPFNVIEKALANPLSGGLAIHSMGFFPVAANHFIERTHGCGEYLLIYCTKGEGWYVLDGKKHVVTENNFFILPANRAHAYGSGAENPWTIYWIHFQGSLAPHVYAKLPGIHSIPLDNESRINDRILFFEELIAALELQHDEDMINYANMSLHHLLGTFLFVQSYRDVKLRKKGGQNTFFISLATHYMNENIEKRLTLEEISSYFGYSPSHFYRLFLKEIHYSPMNYFTRLKIERAGQLLVSTRMKITEIAHKLGFEDPYYFSRVFSKTMGMPPKKYRETHAAKIQN